MNDLEISGSYCDILCNCSRWDVDNYSIIIETWLNKSDLQTLNDSILPGAIGEFTPILGKHHYYDQTWEGKNTLILISNASSNSTLGKMRSKTIFYPKNITTSPIRGDNRFINVKIEGYISANTSL
jgi:hypothetical protein